MAWLIPLVVVLFALAAPAAASAVNQTISFDDVAAGTTTCGTELWAQATKPQTTMSMRIEWDLTRDSTSATLIVETCAATQKLIESTTIAKPARGTTQLITLDERDGVAACPPATPTCNDARVRHGALPGPVHVRPAAGGDVHRVQARAQVRVEVSDRFHVARATFKRFTAAGAHLYLDGMAYDAAGPPLRSRTAPRWFDGRRLVGPGTHGEHLGTRAGAPRAAARRARPPRPHPRDAPARAGPLTRPVLHRPS